MRKKLLKAVVLVLTIGYLGLIYFYLDAYYLQKVLNAPDWQEYKNDSLGYSYIVPQSWKTQTIEKHSGVGFDSDLWISSSALPQAYIEVIFYKNPHKDQVKYLLDGSDPRTQVDTQTRTINGVEYIVIHYPPRLRSGYKAGNYLLAKDYSLLVETRLAYPSERSFLEEKKEEQIINRIFNSIKRL